MNKEELIEEIISLVNDNNGEIEYYVQLWNGTEWNEIYHMTTEEGDFIVTSPDGDAEFIPLEGMNEEQLSDILGEIGKELDCS